MKRKNASLLGNVLMGLGLVVMVVGVGYSILNQLPQLNLPQFFAHGAILSIFVGAVLWLAGARIGGHEQGGFADVGQTDDTAFESHDLNHLNLWIINLLQGTDCRKLNSFAYYTRCAAKMPHDNGLLRLKGVQTVGRFGQPVL